MLWMQHLDDRVKMRLAIALLQSIQLPTSKDAEIASTGQWEGETAEELMDIIYSARTVQA